MYVSLCVCVCVFGCQVVGNASLHSWYGDLATVVYDHLLAESPQSNEALLLLQFLSLLFLLCTCVC